MKIASFIVFIFTFITSILIHYKYDWNPPLITGVVTAFAIVSGIIFFSILISNEENDDMDGDGI
tara:strand:+ start:234 stop:425 length:192 start_codon:yes stop_codon:yes gene_type:complete